MSDAGLAQRRGLADLSSLASALSLAVVAGLILYLAGRPLSTDDFWWHVKMGEVFATQGLWLADDPISHTAAGSPPAPHQWLFGVALHILDRSVGLQGLRVVHVLAVAGIGLLAWWVLRRESHSVSGTCFATLVFGVLAWWRLFQFRPDLVSIASTLALCVLLFRPKREADGAGWNVPSWGRVAAAVAILVVWANCHTLFAIGPALIVAALLGCAVQAGLRAWARGRGVTLSSWSPLARRLAATLGLGIVATLLNPRGFEQHLTFFRSAESSALWAVRDDWAPFDPLGGGDYGPAMSPLTFAAADVLLAAFALFSLVGAIHFLRDPSERSLRGIDPLAFGLGLAGVVAAGTAVRFLWMGFLPLLFVLRVGHSLSDAVPGGEGTRSWAFAGLSAALALAFPILGGFGAAAFTVPRDLTTYLATPYERDKYYREGVEFLRTTGLEGRLFNSYAMGGFTAYWLTPKLRTFVDGRMNFGDDVLRDYKSVTLQRGSEDDETFLDVLDRRSVDVFFGVGVPTGPRNREVSLYTTANLERSAQWLLVSRSMRHAIYLREGERNRENLARVADYYTREGVPFDPERGLDVSVLIEERPDWAARHNLMPAQYAGLLELAANPDPARRVVALEALGLCYALAGAYPEQLEVDRAAAALRPRAKAPRRRLVYGLLRLDRPNQALAVAQELVAIDPGDRRSEAFLKVSQQYRSASREHKRTGRRRSVPLDAWVNVLPLVGD